MDACAGLAPSLVDTVPHFLEALALLIKKDGNTQVAAPLAGCGRVLFGGCALSSSAVEVLTGPGVGLSLASQYGQTELGGMILIGVRSRNNLVQL